MNKTLKWVLIGLGIALAAFMIAIPIFFVIVNRQGAAMMGSEIFGRAGRMIVPVPFFSFFGFFRVLFPLGLLALVVTGIVLLVRGGRSSSVAQTAVPPLPSTGPVQSETAQRICQKCGKSLHPEGEYCPFCGEKQQNNP